MLGKHISKMTIYGLVLIFVFTFACGVHPSTAVADSFPEREGQTVVDPGGHFSQPDQSGFNEFVSQFEHEYVFVVVDEMEQDQHEYTQSLFGHYDLGSSSVLLVVSMADQAQLAYVLGEDVAEQGMTEDRMDSIIENIYVPFAEEGNVLTGVRSTISSMEKDMQELGEKEQAAVTAEQDAGGDGSPDSSGWPPWIKFLLYSVLLLFGLWLAGTVYRQVIYRWVDKLDLWKADLEQRPFSEQLSRVKGLKMAGETEANFDKWKTDWEDILNTALPRLEETFIDIEDDARNFRFIRSQRLLSHTRRELQDIESSLEKIVSEIDELTTSEAHSRENGKKLEEEYHEIRASLQQKSVALGIAYPVLHEKNKQVALWFQEFHEAQENGDYFQAQDLLKQIETVLAEMSAAIREMPALIHEVEYEIPKKLKELQQAVEEMKEHDYQLEHTDIEHRLLNFHEWRHPAVEYMENSDIDKLKQWQEETMQEIDNMFAQLEEEVEAKAFVFSRMKSLADEMHNIQETMNTLQEEVTQIKQSYSWDTEWNESLEDLQHKYADLQRLSDECQVEEEELHQLYPKLKPVLERFQEEKQYFLEKIDTFGQQLAEIREDELKAKEVFERLKRTMSRLKTNLRKSNLPGLPDYVRSGLSMADEALAELETDLEHVPLEIHRVQHHVKEAEAQVDSLSQVVEVTIEQAHKTEFLIQYANRYRRTDQEINAMLEDAEQAFRHYEYREALEFVEEALDKADKQWRKKVDPEEKSVS